MTNTKLQELEQYVTTLSDFTQSLYSRVINSKSKATRRTAVRIANAYLDKANPTAFSSKEWLDSTPIQEVLTTVSVNSFKQERWTQLPIIKPLFTRLAVWSYSYLFDLNARQVARYAEEKTTEYYEMGDATFLAGVYLLYEGTLAEEQCKQTTATSYRGK